jgi:hypothetical protein
MYVVFRTLIWRHVAPQIIWVLRGHTVQYLAVSIKPSLVQDLTNHSFLSW